MRPAPSPDELKGLILIFDDICGDIPTPMLHPAMKESMSLTDKNGQPIFWDGRAIKLGYAKLQERAEGRQSAPASQPAECTFCDEERMCKIWVPIGNGYVTAPCRDCRPKAFEQYMQNWHKENGAKQEPVSLSLVERVKDKLTFLCDSCDRKSVEDYQQVRPCKRLLNVAEGSEGSPELCKGTLRKAHRAECMNEECERFRMPCVVIAGTPCACGSEMQTV